MQKNGGKKKQNIDIQVESKLVLLKNQAKKSNLRK